MAVIVRLPPSLRPLAGNQALVEAPPATILEIIAHLDTRYPGLRAQLLDAAGRRRKFVNIFVNGEDIRRLQHEATRLADRDELEIVPIIAGG